MTLRLKFKSIFLVLIFQTRTWSNAPFLPAELSDASAAQFEDTLVVLGGSLDTAIWRFNTDTLSFEPMEQTLTTGRGVFPSVVVPDDEFICQ